MQTNDDRHTEFTIDFREQGHHAARGLRIERGNWLVGQNNPCPLNEGAGDCGPLLLPTRQGGRALPGLIRNANTGQRQDCLLALRNGEASEQTPPNRHFGQETDQNIGHQRQSFNQIELLKHKTDLSSPGTDVPIEPAPSLNRSAENFDNRFTAGISNHEAIDLAQQG